MACPPLQCPGFVPSGPGLLSPVSLAEFWVSAVVSVLTLLPGMRTRACGNDTLPVALLLFINWHLLAQKT